MIITYKPCGTKSPAKWTQPQPNIIRCEWRGKVYEIDFSDPGVEIEIPDTNELGQPLDPNPKDVVHKAWRDTDSGPLHLMVPSLGPLNEPVTIDHGETEELGW